MFSSLFDDFACDFQNVELNLEAFSTKLTMR